MHIIMVYTSCIYDFPSAGLTVEERSIVESAFRKGVLCVLMATLSTVLLLCNFLSALGAGVNLPGTRQFSLTCMQHEELYFILRTLGFLSWMPYGSEFLWYDIPPDIGK